MEDILIEILALDTLIKSYRDALDGEGVPWQTDEEQMAFFEVHDRATELLKHKVNQLPSDQKEAIQEQLWVIQNET